LVYQRLLWATILLSIGLFRKLARNHYQTSRTSLKTDRMHDKICGVKLTAAFRRHNKIGLPVKRFNTVLRYRPPVMNWSFLLKKSCKKSKNRSCRSIFQAISTKFGTMVGDKRKAEKRFDIFSLVYFKGTYRKIAFRALVNFFPDFMFSANFYEGIDSRIFSVARLHLLNIAGRNQIAIAIYSKFIGYSFA